eukprot:TRINITY_DN3070_c0_g2_i1.p2 TRINITY_DN3070_c0_g2~~TRINITY_DN3070_c0_g2_i1.p2  ORF type:complete len:68 (-),score=13.74 TRINITY_DN3070_c0_g2_i1:479-682(-)
MMSDIIIANMKTQDLFPLAQDEKEQIKNLNEDMSIKESRRIFHIFWQEKVISKDRQEAIGKKLYEVF